ncbi:integrin beta-PS-like [Anticarsia gemmatalis]|uniref:integrin beta-PS-like n=1 Tax=Anticarsia gemmatalis TaxID=129554 RepID=UPI003F7646F4
MNFRIFLLLVFGVCYVLCEPNDCINRSKCGECISSHKCAWCAQDKMADNSRRCMPHSALNPAWCDKKFIKYPTPKTDIIMNKSFNQTITIDDATVQVQFKPQKINIKARPGFTNKFTMSYHPAQDFPLDVYYVMDISDTMRKKKEELKSQAKQIYAELTTYTNNVRLGIGSFVEKPGFPYVDKWKTNSPHLSYSFKNDMKLSTDWQTFERKINSMQFGANYDDPEAGLDALMQAMACTKEVGWRPEARRIIVLCTDSTYHSAGDGKALGAIKPNDMQCHLDNEMYNETLSLTYDYPSVSQINKIAREGHFIVIFAVTNNVVPVYKALANQIVGAKHADLDDGTSALDIIKKAYRETENSVQLSYNLPDFIELTLDQNCESTPKKNCESFPEARQVDIGAELKIKRCPDDGSRKYDLKISKVGIPDYLSISIDIDCECDCEKNNTAVSPACHNGGALQCGICKCNPDRYGIDCRCNSTSSNINVGVENCRMHSQEKLCSGKGSCVCGKCETCQPGSSGEYCQYDVNACPKNCNNRGSCIRNQCECDSGWDGNDCSCTLSPKTCYAPHSKQLCSGNGDCKCGKCHCKPLPGKNETYSGIYCDACDDCAEKRCKDLEDYVYCNFMNTKAVCDEKYKASDTIVTFMNKTEFNALQSAKWCRKRLDNDSYIVFKYQYNNAGTILELSIQNELELPPKANIFIAVGAAVGTVLLVGILTLIIWKILVDKFDKREYEKFANDAKAAGYDVSSTNPLYDPPAVNFTNPTFEHK